MGKERTPGGGALGCPLPHGVSDYLSCLNDVCYPHAIVSR